MKEAIKTLAVLLAIDAAAALGLLLWSWFGPPVSEGTGWTMLIVYLFALGFGALLIVALVTLLIVRRLRNRPPR